MFTVCCVLLFILSFFSHKALMDKQDDVLEIIAVSMADCVLLSTVISAILFVFSVFSYFLLFAVESSMFILCMAVCMKKGINVFGGFDLKKISWVPVVLGVIGILLTMVHSEMFGIGQDEGVYQIEAMAFASGETGLVHGMDEAYILTDEDDINEYLNMVDSSFTGFYRFQEDELTMEHLKDAASVGVMEGVFHGIHLFPVLLGAWASMFGIRNMAGFQSFLYVISIFLMYYAAYGITQDSTKKKLVCALFAFSPVVVWLTKWTLSESVLELAMVMFIYFMTKKQKSTFDIVMIGMCAVYFVTNHIIGLIFFPVFFAVYVLGLIRTKDARYSVPGYILSAGMMFSTYFMSATSVRYYYENISRLYFIPHLDQYNIVYAVYAGSLAAALFIFIFTLLRNRINFDRLQKVLMYISKILIVLSASYFVRLGIAYYQGNGNTPYWYGSGMNAVLHLSVTALVIYSGIFAYLYIIVRSLTVKYEEFAASGTLEIMIMFIYMACLYPTFIKGDIPYYYYYSRYLSYMMPVIAIYAGMLTGDKDNRIFISAIILSVCLMLPFDIVIAPQLDDTFATWDEFYAIADMIEPGSAVILSERGETRRIYAFPLKIVADCDVFPVLTDREGEKQLLCDNYEHVYLLSEYGAFVEDYGESFSADDPLYLDGGVRNIRLFQDGSFLQFNYMAVDYVFCEIMK